MKLVALFSDGMVLQREIPIPVWGWDTAGATVTVELAGNTARAIAGPDGYWKAILPALPAGGPHVLVVRGSQQAEVRDVLVGEVWLCSGQSNMEWPLSMCANGKAEAAAADFPQIRLFTVTKQAARVPARDVSSTWFVCTPECAAEFSGVGYFFGRELHRRLGVPIGLIHTSWGGTPGQAWTSREAVESDPALRGYAEELHKLLQESPEQIRVRCQRLRADFLRQLPQDKGNRSHAEGWNTCAHDDSGWPTMRLPNYWASAGHPTNGVFWFRLAVDVPPAWAGRPLQLELGAIDKSDETYFNGQRVGGLSWMEDAAAWFTPRVYNVPGALVNGGRNVIAVRVVSNYTGGGLPGPAGVMKLRVADDPGTAPISLAGAWRYCMEQDFGRITKPVQPALPVLQELPSMLFNAMIAPLVPYALRGVIWYQGESNVHDARQYRTLFPVMIRDWRRRWEQGDFPFYFVQLANYAADPATATAIESRWAELREAQAETRHLPNTGMAVTIDIGEAGDIHPRNKLDVGLRLARLALAQIHGQPVTCRGPRFRAAQREEGALRVRFDHAEGLRSQCAAIAGFMVAGEDRIFHPAEARIDGMTVVLTSARVPAPVAARYGWADAPVCTLQNGDGLPAEPFRTDVWPMDPGQPV